MATKVKTNESGLSLYNRYSAIVPQVEFDAAKFRAEFETAGVKNAALLDSLTAWKAADYTEYAAERGAGFARARIVWGISHDAVQMDSVKGTNYTDKNGGTKTYGETRAPLTRFIMDFLKVGKTEATATVSLSNAIFDGDGNLKPLYSAFSWGALKVMNTKANDVVPLSYAAAHIDATTPVADIPAAMDAMKVSILNDRAREQAAKDGETSTRVDDNADAAKDGETSTRADDNADAANTGKGTNKGKAADAAKVESFLLARVVRDADKGFKLAFAHERESEKELTIHAAKASEIVNTFKASAESVIVPLSLSVVTGKDAVIFPDVFAGYNVKGAYMELSRNGADAFAWYLLQPRTGDAKEESDAEREKRVKKCDADFVAWLSGLEIGADVPKAADIPDALKVFNDAKRRVMNTPRLTAAAAIKAAISESVKP